MGTLINAIAILIGGGLGLLFRKRFPERISQTALQVMGLFTILVGVKMALGGEELILALISLALGSMLGEWINIEDRLEKFAFSLEERLHLTEYSSAKGFIHASLLFCVGSIAIVGSITEGLQGDPSILITKAMLDGIISIPFAAGMGIGVLALVVLVLSFFLRAGPAQLERGEDDGRKAKTLLICSSLFAYAIVVVWLGFVLATFAFVFFLLRVVESERWWVSAAKAALITLGNYGLFVVWLGIKLPRGVLPW